MQPFALAWGMVTERNAALFGALSLAVAGPIIPRIRAQGIGPREAQTQGADLVQRTVEIKEESSDMGISSGLVVAYGHPLHPPYHLEYRGNLLFVNGVQVEPTLVMQRESDKHRTELTPDEATRLTGLDAMADKARKYYFDQTGKESEERLHVNILAMVRANPLVKEAHWMNEKILVYTRKDDPYPSMNGISFSSHPSGSSVKPLPQEKLQKHRIDWYESNLKMGKCVFFGSIGAWNGDAASCHDIKKAIGTVMEQPGLSVNDREKKLRGIFRGDTDTALDVLANYRSEEWK